MEARTTQPPPPAALATRVGAWRPLGFVHVMFADYEMKKCMAIDCCESGLMVCFERGMAVGALVA